MKFLCKVTPTIMDGLVVRWQLEGRGDGEVSASRNGVLICGGWPVLSTDGIEGLKQVLDKAHICVGVIQRADQQSDRKGYVETWLREVAHDEITESRFP